MREFRELELTQARNNRARASGLDRTRWAVRQGTLRLLMSRLEGFHPDGGLDDPDEVLGPVTPAEAAKFGLEEGQVIPQRLAAEVRRSLNVQLQDLFRRGWTSSRSSRAQFGGIVRQLLPGRPLGWLSRQDMFDLHRIVTSPGAQRLDGQISCPRCGNLSQEGLLSCRKCAALLTFGRPLWYGMVVAGIPVLAFGGFALASALAGP
jgi:hypothetical protein